METTSSASTVITNITNLKRQMKLSNRDLARLSGLSDRMIGKILNGESEPTTNSLDKIATALRIRSWQLMLPDLDPSAIHGEKLDNLCHAYLLADNAGRRVMESTADYLTTHKQTN